MSRLRCPIPSHHLFSSHTISLTPRLTHLGTRKVPWCVYLRLSFAPNGTYLLRRLRPRFKGSPIYRLLCYSLVFCPPILDHTRTTSYRPEIWAAKTGEVGPL